LASKSTRFYIRKKAGRIALLLLYQKLYHAFPRCRCWYFSYVQGNAERSSATAPVVSRIVVRRYAERPFRPGGRRDRLDICSTPRTCNALYRTGGHRIMGSGNNEKKKFNALVEQIDRELGCRQAQRTRPFRPSHHGSKDRRYCVAWEAENDGL